LGLDCGIELNHTSLARLRVLGAESLVVTGAVAARRGTMLGIIERHNRLNGVVFSIAEFSLIALVAGAFASYYLVHREAVLAFITSGITVNCLPVVVIGVRMLTVATQQNRIAPFWNKQARGQHLRDNPHMLRDTLALTAAILLPFLATIIVLYELRTSHKA
jgi:hypothetical protein